MNLKSLPLTLSLALAALGPIHGAHAQPSQAESPAFQGHAAETQQRSEEEERRRRALFFDAVAVEIGEPGLPCDHLARSKPQTVAGPAFVVILGRPGKDEDRLRVWIAPGAAGSDDEALRQAHDLAGRRRAGVVHDLIDMRRYLACR
ncbi:hypothetical protein [Bradyrhizobium sp.]|uniref:hypothetical protein n=1 Tax=Bradyrhizobium sp. TaxID=376 RepID=UPI001DE0AE0C|nr:hypothetical protein [Bradyrhizobium sp.]MBI5322468.1 hypothetical protein [Bradyrhizobium sp.]